MNAPGAAEWPFAFRCGGETLPAIVHPGSAAGGLGVLVLTGGPQYRVGSHRQFVHLARRLAAAGFPTMRFDFRGTGDAGGETLDFDTIDAYFTVGEDLGAAISAFLERCPQVERLALWGICSAASAIMIHGYKHPSVVGVVAVNPWVRTKVGIARTMLKHYYRRRLLSAASWGRFVRGEIDLGRSFRELAATLADAVGPGHAGRGASSGPAPRATSGHVGDFDQSLLDLAIAGLHKYRGRGLLILSGGDLTAREFKDAVSRSPEWMSLLVPPRWSVRELAEADHTFSANAWRGQVADWSADWLASLDR